MISIAYGLNGYRLEAYATLGSSRASRRVRGVPHDLRASLDAPESNDRGRESNAPPPSEPDRQFSSIRLSS